MPSATPPFSVQLELPGWELFWTHLELTDAPAGGEALVDVRIATAARARARFAGAEALAGEPTIAAVRRLFRAAGCDPTRYRPSSEALLRRLLKGEELPVIHPFVDLNNCLSVELAVPSCAGAEGSFTPPVTLRAGRPDEAFESLRGPFGLEGKPLLADPAGPFGTPITDSQRVKVQGDTRRAWLVAYLPAGEVDAKTAERTLEDLLRRAPVARIVG